MSKALICSLTTDKDIYRVAWHRNGQYFCTIRSHPDASSLLIHKLTTKATQRPFSKSLGSLQDVHFHPSKPYLILATKLWVRIYNLAQQCLFKKFRTTTNHISKVAT
eukprot:UN06633